METELIITLVGLTVAGLAAVLGIWVERDQHKPPRYAYALSILILLATIVGMYQCYMDAKENEKLEADMARILQMLDKIASSSEVENPELNDFVKTEISAQSRANPSVVAKLAQRVADEGGDPGEMLSQHLPAAEVEGLQRGGGLRVKPSSLKLGQQGAGDGTKRTLSGRRKTEGDAPAEPTAAAAPSAAPAGSVDLGEAKDAPSLLPKGSVDAKGLKPSAGALPDGTAKGAPIAAPKADAPKPATPLTKPKL